MDFEWTAEQQALYDELVRLTERELNEDVIADDHPLLERQVLDSLGPFQLVGYLESAFGVDVQDEEPVSANLGTGSDITRFVRASLDREGA